MAYSYIEYTGDGSTTNFAIPFDYIEEAHVKCAVDGVDTAFTFINDATIQITPAPADGSFIKIYRETSLGERLVDYNVPGTLTEEDLDLDSLQAFYMAQEAIDIAQSAMVADLATGQFDANGRRIVNVGDPVAAQDVATKAYGDANWGQAAVNAAAAQVVLATAQADRAEAEADRAESEADRAQGIANTTAASVTAAAAAEADRATTEANRSAAEADAAAASAAAAATSASNAAASEDAAAASVVQATASGRRKNAIINGHMQVWQRGTSFSSAATGTFSADRWEYIKVGAMVHDLKQSSDVPTVAQAGVLFPYSLLVDCTTADASLAATDVCYVRHKIEGYNWLPLSQRTVTLSFWVKATKPGTYCIAATNAGQDRTYVGEYTVGAADTWEKKTVTLAASPNPVTEGTWNHGSGIGLELRFALAAGSNFQTTAGAWQAGNYLATSNQVNACDSTANNFYITGVQLEAGSVATEFEQRTYQEELVLCQRYYEKSYDYAIAPGTPSPDGARYSFATNIQQFYDYARVDFKVTKRVAPTTTLYSTATGTPGQMHNLTSSADTAAVTDTSGENGFNVISPGSALTPNHLYGFHWVSNAEL